MTEGMGTCKKHNRQFILMEGCPLCLAEKNESWTNPVGEEQPMPNIVKVKYYSETTGELSNREYTYYSEEPLKIGDVVMVPVRDTTGKAQVSAVDVPESDIQAFKDKVKTIPVGSKFVVDSKVNLCDTCIKRNDYPICTHSNVQFGNGKGNDNIIKCGNYIKGDAAPCSIPLNTNISPSPHLSQPETDMEDVNNGDLMEVSETALIRIKPDLDVAVVKLYEESCKLLSYAQARDIQDEAGAKTATNDLSIIAGVKKAIEDRRKEYTGPINDHLKSVNQAFQEFTAPLLQADHLNRDKVRDYRNAVEARRQEEERINRLRMEAAQAEMELKGELTESVDVIETTAPAPKVTRTDMGSAGTVDHWKAEVVDFALLPDEYKLPNMQMLNSAARTYKDKRTIPGVRIFNQPEIRVTTKKGGF